MDSERYARLSELFAEVCDLPPDEAATRLRSLRREDSELARELAELLAHDVTATVALDRGVSLAERPGLRLPPGTRLGRYRLLRSIGSGGAGEVYEAAVVEPADHLDGHARVAVKVLHAGRVRRPEALEAFRREARLGAAVHHPNVARTFEAGVVEHDGRDLHHLVMEYVEGRTLAAYLDEHGALAELPVRHVGAAVARALAALHAVGVVHRDVKPSNVVITRDDVVKLTDLGIALDPEALRDDVHQGRFVGTLAYAAPEQLGGSGEVGPRTDLHALGVVLRELLCGEPPYRLESGEATVEAILAGRAAGKRPVASGVSHSLLELVGELTAAQPSDRPADAELVAEALARGTDSAWWRSRAASDEPWTRLGAPDAHALRGREDELARLLASIDRVVAGEGSVTALTGPPGSGRSRLLRETLVVARRAGREFELLVSSGVPDEGLVGRLAPDAPAGDPDRAVADATRAALARVADRPLVAVFDALDRADERERRLAAALARATPDRPIAVIAAWASSPDLPLARVLGSHAALRYVELGDLPEHARRSLLADRLGDAQTVEQVTRAMQRFGATTPAALLTSLDHLIRDGALQEVGAGRWVVSKPLDGTAAPRALHATTGEWFRALPAPRRRLVALAACGDGRVGPAALARAVGASRLETAERLAAIEAAGGPLRHDAARLRFEPPSTAEVVRGELDDATRRELHATLAHALADGLRASGLDDGAAGEAALHAVLGDLPEVLATVLGQGLGQLVARGRHDDVARVADRAAALPGLDPRRRIALLNTADDADALAGRNTGRIARLEQVLELATRLGDPEAHFDALVHLCTAASNVGDAVVLERHARAALDLVDVPAPRRVEAYRHLGEALSSQARLPEAVEVLREGIAAADAERTPFDAAAQRVQLAGELVRMRRLDEADALLRTARDHVAALDQPRVWFSYHNVAAGLARRRGQLDTAAEHLDRALELAEQTGDRQRQSVALSQLGALRHSRLDLPGARAAIAASVSLMREFGANAALGLARLGDLARAEGHWEVGLERLAEARVEARRHGDTLSELSAWAFEAALEADRGRGSRALVAARRQRELAASIGDPLRAAIAGVAVAVTELALGSVEVAEPLLLEAEAVLARTPSPHRVTAALALARVAESRGDREGAERRIRTAHEVAERCNLDEARAAVAALAAPYELRRGRIEQAREVARELRSTGRRAGLRGAELEALALLARTSGPPPDPALLREVERVLDEVGSRLPHGSRVAAVAHLVATDPTTYRARAAALLQELRAADPDFDAAAAGAVDPALAVVLSADAR